MRKDHGLPNLPREEERQEEMKRKIFYSIMLFLLGVLFFSSWRIPAAAGNAADGKWNLLLITIDTLRADRLGCYGYGDPLTPNIDRLAEGGALFSRAFAHTPTTLPSHANILLGMTPPHHGIHDNLNFFVPGGSLTLAAHLKKSGYETGAFVGAYPLDSRFGLNRGFDHYDDYLGSRESEDHAYLERKAEAVVDAAMGWLEDRRGPWFLWVHCFDPHAPYEPPEPFAGRYRDRLYDGEVAYVDFALKRIFDHLRDRNLFEKTVVVFTSDHGESLGRHGERTHGYFAYNTTIHVPLIIAYPGGKPVEIAHNVSHIDIFPTVCDLLAVEKPRHLQGESLVPLLRGRRMKERPIYFESLYPYYSRGWAPLRGYIFGNVKFIESPLPELYDLAEDFDETRNLAGGRNLDRHKRDLSRLKESLSAEKSAEAARKLDRASLEKLRSLGYVGGMPVVRKERFGPEDDIKTLLPFHKKAAEALEMFRRGEANRAVAVLKEVLDERRDVDVAYSYLARIYENLGKPEEAVETLILGRRALPSSYEVFQSLVEAYMKTGRYEDVILTIRDGNLFQMEHDPEIWNTLGLAYTRIGNFEEALKVYDTALHLNDRYPVAYHNLATVYGSLYARSRDAENFRRAVDNFKKAIELDPLNAHPLNGLGVIHWQAGLFEDALGFWEKAVSLQPDFDQALFNLGRAYLERGEKARALDVLTRYKDHHYRFLSREERDTLDTLIRKCGNTP